MPAILLGKQQYCLQYYWLFNNIASIIADDIARNIADYAAILLTILLISIISGNIADTFAGKIVINIAHSAILLAILSAILLATLSAILPPILNQVLPPLKKRKMLCFWREKKVHQATRIFPLNKANFNEQHRLRGRQLYNITLRKLTQHLNYSP